MSGPRKIAFAAVLLLVLVLITVWWSTSSKMPSVGAKPEEALPIARLAESQSVLPADYPQLSLKTMSRKEAIRAFNQNTKHDMRYEWKIPIRFYGKVVDQFNDPVCGAKVRFSWTDLSPKGTSTRDAASDANGCFSLDGVKGKGIMVKISKEGYYDVSHKNNQVSFEYASPAETTFYEPDPNHPFVFHMRKKGDMPELVVKKVKLNVAGQGGSALLDFLSGKTSSQSGQLKVTVWKPTITNQQINAGKVFPVDWKIVVEIPNGGLLEHKETFPFEAPEDGYVPNFEFAEHVTGGGGLLDRDFYFFYGDPRVYGRMHIRTDAFGPAVFVDYWLNPSGSRNLEYDPQKQSSAPSVK